MNMEIQSAEVKNNEPYKFTFSKPIQQLMVGFSQFTLQYKPPDHHIRTISIDLSDCKKNGNEVVIKPNLVFEDKSKKSKPGDMTITIVVVATVGEGNPNVHLMNGLKANVSTEFPSNLTDIKAALFSAYVKFTNEDHHLTKYESVIVPYLNQNTYSLNGNSTLKDKTFSTFGPVQGSAIVYNKNDPSILCQEFNSRQLNGHGEICLGKAPQGFKPEDYQIGCFINGYDVSFTEEDHHVLKIDVSSKIGDGGLVVRDGSVYATVYMKAFLTDNGKNQTNIPHNAVTGFVLAFKNKP